MARGYPGAFGRRVNACTSGCRCACCSSRRSSLPAGADVAQAAPVAAAPRPADAARLLGLAGVLQPRRHRAVGAARLSVPALSAGADAAAGLRARASRASRCGCVVPISWLAVGVVFLVGFRIGLNVLNSNVIDVGYAGVIGADKLIHGQPLYGHWPERQRLRRHLRAGQLLRLRPVPADLRLERDLGLLPAAHAAAIAFDLLTLLGLFLLGRRIRGPTLGVVLAYAWAAYPFTLFALSSNTNDALVALLLVLALLVIASAPARGVVGGAGRADQVRPARAGAAAPARDRRAPAAPRSVVAVRARLRAHRARGDAARCCSTATCTTSGTTRSPTRPAASRRSRSGACGAGSAPQQHLLQGAAVALAIAVAFVPARGAAWSRWRRSAAAVLIALAAHASTTGCTPTSCGSSRW